MRVRVVTGVGARESTRHGPGGTAMKWSDQYSTGIAHVDEQHKLLFRLAERLREILADQGGVRLYAQWLDVLETYARSHFRYEEGCMHRLQCPAAGANSAAHGQFQETVASFQRRYADRGYIVADGRELVEFLEGWLTDHIARIDVQLRSCVGTSESSNGRPPSSDRHP